MASSRSSSRAPRSTASIESFPAKRQQPMRNTSAKMRTSIFRDCEDDDDFPIDKSASLRKGPETPTFHTAHRRQLSTSSSLSGQPSSKRAKISYQAHLISPTARDEHPRLSVDILERRPAKLEWMLDAKKVFDQAFDEFTGGLNMSREHRQTSGGTSSKELKVQVKGQYRALEDLQKNLEKAEKEKQKLAQELKDSAEKLKARAKKSETTKLRSVIQAQKEHIEELQASQDSDSRIGVKVLDTDIKELWAQLQHDIYQFTKDMLKPLHAELKARKPHEEEYSCFHEQTDMPHEFMRKAQLRPHLVEAFIWKLLYENIFKTRARFWAPPHVARAVSIALDKATEACRGNDEQTNLSDLNDWRSRTAVFMSKIFPVSEERVNDFAKSLVHDLFNALGCVPIEKTLAEMNNIVSTATTLDGILRRSRALFAVCYSDADDEGRGYFNLPYSSISMKALQVPGLPANRDDPEVVDLVVSPSLSKRGTADGREYNRTAVIEKARVVCDVIKRLDEDAMDVDQALPHGIAMLNNDATTTEALAGHIGREYGVAPTDKASSTARAIKISSDEAWGEGAEIMARIRSDDLGLQSPADSTLGINLSHHTIPAMSEPLSSDKHRFSTLSSETQGFGHEEASATIDQPGVKAEPEEDEVDQICTASDEALPTLSPEHGVVQRPPIKMEEDETHFAKDTPTAPQLSLPHLYDRRSDRSHIYPENKRPAPTGTTSDPSAEGTSEEQQGGPLATLASTALQHYEKTTAEAAADGKRDKPVKSTATSGVCGDANDGKEEAQEKAQEEDEGPNVEHAPRTKLPFSRHQDERTGRNGQHETRDAQEGNDGGYQDSAFPYAISHFQPKSQICSPLQLTAPSVELNGQGEPSPAETLTLTGSGASEGGEPRDSQCNAAGYNAPLQPQQPQTPEKYEVSCKESGLGHETEAFALKQSPETGDAAGVSEPQVLGFLGERREEATDQGVVDLTRMGDDTTSGLRRSSTDTETATRLSEVSDMAVITRGSIASPRAANGN